VLTHESRQPAPWLIYNVRQKNPAISDMARMVVIYRNPKDRSAFDRHYFGVHVPLAKALPGIRRYEVSVSPVVSVAGWKDVYLVATLHFDSLDAIKAAFASETGKACAADRRIFAPADDDVQMYLFDDREV
jgi:uncharacterized protein (TIGR02118 family)